MLLIVHYEKKPNRNAFDSFILQKTQTKLPLKNFRRAPRAVFALYFAYIPLKKFRRASRAVSRIGPEILLIQ